MTFDQLEYFLSCASCQNFSIAAKYHFVSVSTLSRNITSLEEELGFKLFNRGYHGHTLTREGKRFYNFAERVMSCQSDFWESLGRLGAATPKEADQLHIACYPFDNMFGKIVLSVNAYPSDWLGKTYKIYFLGPGSMPQAVSSGKMDVGIDSMPHIAPFEKDFGVRPFYRAGYKLVVGTGNPLAGRRSISAEELISEHSRLADYLPGGDGSGSGRIHSADDLRHIGERTILNMATLLDDLKDFDLDKKMLILPQELRLPALRGMREVGIDSSDVYIDYVAFWRKDNRDPAVYKMVEMLNHF